MCCPRIKDKGLILNTNITKLNPGSKLAILLSVIILVGFMAFNWIVSPQTTYLRAAKLYENMLGDAGKMTTVIRGQMATKKKEVSQLDDEIALAQGRFFTAKQAAELFLDLEPIARQSNCNLDELAFSSPETLSYESDEGEACAIVVKRSTISFTSTYGDVINFLTKLSSYMQRIEISDLTIELDNMINKQLHCRMTITIYVIEDTEHEENE